MMNQRSSFLYRLPRAILRLYPRRFREDFGEAAVSLLRHDLEELQKAPTIRRIIGSTKQIADFALQGLLEVCGHLVSRPPRGRRSSGGSGAPRPIKNGIFGSGGRSHLHQRTRFGT